MTKGEISDLVAQAASLSGKGDRIHHDDQAISERLQRFNGDPDAHHVARGSAEVWWFVSARNKAIQTGTLESLLAFCSSVGARVFNYVAFDCAGARQPHVIFGQEISKRCEALHLGYRVFPVSVVAGTGHPRVECNEVLLQFLSVLLSLKSEIEERSPQYFDFQALRCLAAEDVAVNLLSAEVAADLLLRIAKADGTTNSRFPIVSAKNTPLAVLCERIGIACNLSLLPVQDKNDLNAIDRVFQERLGPLEDFLMSCALEVPSTEAYRVAYLSPDRSLLDEEAQVALFESMRRDQDEVRVARRRQAAELPARLTLKTIEKNGSEFIYYVGGSKGPAVIVLNALGQGLEYWYRLLDNLIEDHLVIIWEPRGTVAPPPPFGLNEQVDDLAAVVEQEGIESCHLIGWCTGPKVAIEFHLRRPTVVRSMAFLNASLKCDGGSEELDSPYEHNMESLCRMLVRKPAMASSVMSTLRARTEESEREVLEDRDGEEMSVSVLSLMNAGLKGQVLAPFRTEETTIHYSHQLVDFWKHDVRLQASRVQLPVLLVSTEYDQVATPAASVEAAKLFPDSRHVHVKGATHYCLYDRPEFVGALLRRFFAGPSDLPNSQCASDKVSHGMPADRTAAGTSAATATFDSSRSAYGS